MRVLVGYASLWRGCSRAFRQGCVLAPSLGVWGRRCLSIGCLCGGTEPGLGIRIQTCSVEQARLLRRFYSGRTLIAHDFSRYDVGLLSHRTDES